MNTFRKCCRDAFSALTLRVSSTSLQTSIWVFPTMTMMKLTQNQNLLSSERVYRSLRLFFLVETQSLHPTPALPLLPLNLKAKGR